MTNVRITEKNGVLIPFISADTATQLLKQKRKNHMLAFLYLLIMLIGLISGTILIFGLMFADLQYVLEKTPFIHPYLKLVLLEYQQIAKPLSGIALIGLIDEVVHWLKGFVPISISRVE